MKGVKSYSCDGLSYYFSIRRHSHSRSSTYFLLSNTERFANNFYSYSLCRREKKNENLDIECKVESGRKRFFKYNSNILSNNIMYI